MGFSLNCLLLSFFIPAYCEKQPGIGLYRAFSKCIAHAFFNFCQTILKNNNKQTLNKQLINQSVPSFVHRGKIQTSLKFTN